MLTDFLTGDLLRSLQKRETTAEAVASDCLRLIRAREARLDAFLLVDEEGALSQASAIDARRQHGEPLGPLAGVPLALKDVICIKGQKTTCGSKILRSFVPPYNAHVVEKLRQADAVLIGKTNMDEFAMGSSTENSGYKVTRNPWDVERIPGGSSGGSAAAVAGGCVPLALGTDTGGSIRQPAAMCGIVGVKPSYGRVSRFGMVAFASSLEQIGPMARDVEGAARLLEVISGHDHRDSTSANVVVPRYSQQLDEPVLPLTIGVAREHFGEGVDPEVEASVREALKVYQARGAMIRDISLPNTPHAVATYYLVATAEASSNLARYDGVHYGHRAEKFSNLIDMMSRSREEGFGTEVKRRIMLGTFILSSGYIDAYYVKALRVRRLIKDDFDRAFKECDVIIGPTAPTPAFRIGEKSADPLAMYLSDIYTISANLAGIPGISVPCGFTKTGLPIGMQIQAGPFEEEKLLRVARMYERETDWTSKRPTI